MKRFIYTVLAVAALCGTSHAQGGARRTTLIARFDLDGAAASATVIAAAQQIVDSSSYTIAAQPDTPRPLNATLTDADSSISACVLTITGTLANGTVVSATTNLTGGSGVKVLSPNYNFNTVTSISTGVCTGEGGAADTVSVGTTSTIPPVYVGSFGFASRNWQGVDFKDVWQWREEERKAKTTGSSITLTSNTAAQAAFSAVAVGDLLLFRDEERVVATKTDDNNITVEAAIDLSSGLAYSYRKAFRGPDTEDGWIQVGPYTGGTIEVIVSTTQIVGTGGINATLQCRQKGADQPVVTESSTNITTVGNTLITLDLRTKPAYDQCRVGLGWGTNDDANDLTTNTEIQTVQFSVLYSVGR